ncbi:MAG: hypothetical protein K0Q49_928 [Haloplasmataceae bacterium]|jgi:hypothetical protein|nr:hypothetical protein [Haloplasmataceae bacterium]
MKVKVKGMKKTLLTCALMFVFSVTMLLGTTYAWWSETIVIDENIIQMGNLDLQVKFGDPKELATDITAMYDLEEYTTTGFFETTKTIQPGSTDTRIITLKNVGSVPLAVRFNTFVDVTNPLNEHISFKFINYKGVAVYDAPLSEMSTKFVVLQPSELTTFWITYTVDVELGDNNGSFGEGLKLPFVVTVQAEQVAKAQQLEAIPS